MERQSFLNEFEIVTLKTGIKSLRSLAHHETFHPVTGPWVEANVLHVEQQRLVERCSQTTPKFVIWDVGFGAAANVLAAIEALRQGQTNVEIHSFDQTTAPIEFALSHAHELGYLVPYEQVLRELLTSHQVSILPHIQWQLHLGDFRDQIKNGHASAPHAIFYDPYSPIGNQEMWTLEHFSRVRQCLKSDIPCLLTNYTRSTAVRTTLLLAGFFVGRGCEIGEKAETTIASNQMDLIEYPLDHRWLERVRNSTNAAPFRALAYSKAPISDLDFELLQMSPQFCLR